MESKICFLIPIYPPDYHYLIFLKDLTINDKFMIIFIFTYLNDFKLFENIIISKNYSTYKNISHIILEDNHIIKPYISSFDHKDKGIINIKKIYGLYYIITNSKYNFDYIACVDCEIRFINTKKVYDKFKLYCERKTAICGNTSIRQPQHFFLENIHNECLNYIKQIDIEKINNLTNNGNFYFWYSDINIYDVKLLPDFLKYISFDYSNFSNFIKRMNFFTFDYIIYYYYCMIYHDYKLLCMEHYNINRHWSMEASSFEIYDAVKNKMNYETNIVIGNCYYKNVEKFKDNMPLFIYNLNNGRYNNIYNRNVDYLDN